MRTHSLALLIAAVIVSQPPTLFEISCYTVDATGQTQEDEKIITYDHHEVINLKFHPDFLNKLEHGFCLIGPVDIETRRRQYQDMFQDFLEHHQSEMDHLQGVPDEPGTINDK